MATEGKIDFDSKKLWVDEQVWRDAATGDSEVAFSNMIDAAADMIGRDGAFIIDSERGVLRHIHRTSELEDLVRETNATRAEIGLAPFATRCK